MENSIDWGQGVNNNTIGWGKGTINNSISWGAVYALSYSGQMDLLGIFYELVVAFQSRVATDSGTFEGEKCLLDNLENFKIY